VFSPVVGLSKIRALPPLGLVEAAIDDDAKT
jgi:hypothetical protein